MKKRDLKAMIDALSQRVHELECKSNDRQVTELKREFKGLDARVDMLHERVNASDQRVLGLVAKNIDAQLPQSHPGGTKQ